MQNKEEGADGPADLRVRTKRFALRVIAAYTSLSRDGAAHVLGHQMLRSATSVGAHYREACRARSPAEFISKMEGGLQEFDETAYWMELLVDSRIVPGRRLSALMGEAEELIAIFVSSIKTAKGNRDP